MDDNSKKIYNDYLEEALTRQGARLVNTNAKIPVQGQPYVDSTDFNKLWGSVDLKETKSMAPNPSVYAATNIVSMPSGTTTISSSSAQKVPSTSLVGFSEVEFISKDFKNKIGRVINFNDASQVAIIAYYKNFGDALLMNEKVKYSNIKLQKSYNKEQIVRDIKPFKDINFFSNNTEYSFNYIFYSYGINNKDVFIEYKKFFGMDSLNMREDHPEDILMLLPKDYCDYSGYNEEFINWYIEKLNELGLGTITLTGTKEHKLFEQFRGSNGYYNVLINNSFYNVYITSEYPCFKMLLVRFLTFLYYNTESNVPGILKTLIDNRACDNTWQSLCMATLMIFRNILFTTGNATFNKFSLAICPDFFNEKNNIENIKSKLIENENIHKSFKYEVIDSDRWKTLNISNKKQVEQFINNYKQLFL